MGRLASVEDCFAVARRQNQIKSDFRSDRSVDIVFDSWTHNLLAVEKNNVDELLKLAPHSVLPRELGGEVDVPPPQVEIFPKKHKKE